MAAVFAFFLAGAAQTHAGQGVKAFLGNGLAALAAAGHAVDPFRAAPVHGSAGPYEGRFAVEAFQLGGLIKYVHVVYSFNTSGNPAGAGLPYHLLAQQ